MAPRARRTRAVRRFRRYKNIKWYQYNTFRTKMEYYTQITYPNNQAGDISFIAANNSWINLATIINGTPNGDTLRQMFSYLIVTGVRIETQPFSTNTTLVMAQQAPVCLAFVVGTNNDPQALNFNDISQINTSMLLDPLTRQVKYFSFRGATKDLKLTADNNAGGTGGFKVIGRGQARSDGGPAWNMKATLYVYWRYAKVI